MQIKDGLPAFCDDEAMYSEGGRFMSARWILIVGGVLALAGCVSDEVTTPQMAFMDNCAACHGPDARGGGPAAAGLDPAPPDLTQLSARNGGVFPRDYVMSTIDGYSRGTHSRSAMPVFGDGDLGETVIVENADGTGTPIPSRLLALAEYLEDIQQ
jgi:mono/diheme cytochrome c family protein